MSTSELENGARGQEGDQSQRIEAEQAQAQEDDIADRVQRTTLSLEGEAVFLIAARDQPKRTRTLGDRERARSRGDRRGGLSRVPVRRRPKALAAVRASGWPGLLGAGVIETWMESRNGAVERTCQLLDELRASESVDLAKLSVASGQLRNLLAG